MVQSLIEEISNKKFVLDCVSMMLEQQTESEPIIYSGSGYIQQDSDGQISFKLFQADTNFISEISSFFSEYIPGRIIPRSDYYKLNCKDLFGKIWTASNILINTNTGHGTVVTGSISQLTKKYNDDFFNYIIKAKMKLYFIDDIKIPSNSYINIDENIEGKLKNAERSFFSNNYCFTIWREGEVIVVDIESVNGEIGSPLEVKITESLQFIFGRSMQWSLMEIHEYCSETIAIRSVVFGNNEKGNIRPPLSLLAYDYVDDIWKLFDKYFVYVFQAHTEYDKWQYVSSLLHSIIESSRSTLDAQTITLSIAIEGLLNKEFKEKIPKVEKEKIKEELCHVRAALSDIAVSEKTKDRLIGMCSNILNVSPKDSLYRLAKTGCIQEESIKLWSELRNSSVHPDNKNSKTIQEMLDLLFAAQVLFYKLVFLLIRYDGYYTDYSDKFVEKKYQLYD